MHEIDKFARSASQNNGNVHVPVVFCGDFNVTPISGTYRFLLHGRVDADDPDLTYNKQHIARGDLLHSLRLTSAYRALPEPQDVIDYIWVSVDDLLPVQVLSLPRGPLATPTDDAPSDHIPMMAELALVTPSNKMRGETSIKQAAATERVEPAEASSSWFGTTVDRVQISSSELAAEQLHRDEQRQWKEAARLRASKKADKPRVAFAMRRPLSNTLKAKRKSKGPSNKGAQR